MCTPFSRIPQALLMRLDSFFSGALCVLSGGRLPEALFMVFLLDSKGAKTLFIVFLLESKYLYFFEKTHSRERTLKEKRFASLSPPTRLFLLLETQIAENLLDHRVHVRVIRTELRVRSLHLTCVWCSSEQPSARG